MNVTIRTAIIKVVLSSRKLITTIINHAITPVRPENL